MADGALHGDSRSDRYGLRCAVSRHNGDTPAAFGHDNEDGAVVENPAEQDLLDWMRDEYAGGASLNGIARQLNDMGVPTKQYGAKWYASSVKAVLERADGE